MPRQTAVKIHLCKSHVRRLDHCEYEHCKVTCEYIEQNQRVLLVSFCGKQVDKAES